MSKHPVVPLGELLTPASHPQIVDPDAVYPIAGIYGFGRGMIRRPPVFGREIAASQLFRIRAGQFVYSRLKSFEGAFAMVPDNIDGYFVSNEFPSFDVEVERLHPGYLEWYFKQERVWRQLASNNKGIGARRERLHPIRLLDHQIPFPNIDEQRRIAAMFDGVSSGIRRARDLVKAIDDELIQTARSMIWSSIPDERDWTPCKVFLERRALDVTVESDAKYAFAGVLSFGRGVFRADVKQGSGFSYSQLTRLHASDFVYPKLMAWEGALGVVPPEFHGLVVSPEFPVFMVDDDLIRPEVVDTIFRDPRIWPRLQAASTGTNLRRRRLNPEALLAVSVPIPPRPIQNRVVEFIAKNREAKAQHAQTILELDQLIPSLMSEAFG
jgi:type I restriction enzyme S subunit